MLLLVGVGALAGDVGGCGVVGGGVLAVVHERGLRGGGVHVAEGKEGELFPVESPLACQCGVLGLEDFEEELHIAGVHEELGEIFEFENV